MAAGDRARTGFSLCHDCGSSSSSRGKSDQEDQVRKEERKFAERICFSLSLSRQRKAKEMSSPTGGEAASDDCNDDDEYDERHARLSRDGECRA